MWLRTGPCLANGPGFVAVLGVEVAALDEGDNSANQSGHEGGAST
jgi:hypothetical protein